MARIKTYTIDTLISDKDIIIGSDADNNNETKNFPAGLIREFVLSGLEPEVGGNLKITTIVDNDSEETTPEDYFNNSITPIVVLHYEIVFLILNGRTFIFRKNNDVYGVGETQVVSGDFTEIDITSVINSNLQNLDSVLEQGNEAPDKNVKIDSIYLWDNHSNDDYGVIISGDKDRVNFAKSNGNSIGNIDVGQLQVRTTGVGTFALKFPESLALRQVDFQNASGTVAYLSDIPTDYVSSVTTSGEGLSATIDEGVLNINYTSTATPYLISSELLDSISNTTYFLDGGIFEYSEELNPINSILLEFSEDISFVFESPLTVVRVFAFLENNTYQVFNFTKNEMTLQNPQSLLIPFPFSEIWSDVVGERVLSIDISVMPKSISSDEGVLFDGCVPSSICKYVNVF